MSIQSMVTSLFQGSPETGAVVYTRYPLAAVGTTLTASGMTTGAYKYLTANEVYIVAASVITTAFYVAGVSIETFTATGALCVKILTGIATAGVQRAEIAFNQITAAGSMGMNWLPVPPKFIANASIIGNLAHATADTTAVAAVHVRN
jgi:hypothetical protein